MKFHVTNRRTMLLFTLLGITTIAALVFLPIGPAFAEPPVPPPPPSVGAEVALSYFPVVPHSPGPPPRDPQVPPPPPSVGTDIPITYFGPMPSEALIDPRDHALVGPVQLLKAGTVDLNAFTITLPLYRGQMADGRNVWYILTDTTDKFNADSLGLNHSPKLHYAAVGRAVRDARLEQDTSLTFEAGAVDFTPQRAIVPGDAPNFFPPKVANPGSIADGKYTPLVRITNAGGHIYNAPVIAFDQPASNLNFCDGNVDYSRVHDRVTKICPAGGANAEAPAGQENGGGTVTIKMTPIFSFARPTSYLSTDASDPMVAALDMGTFAPALGDVKVGRDDSFASAVERLFPVANGPTGADNPQRQGLNSLLSDKDPKGEPAPPLHVIGGVPTLALDYSPLWDLNLAVWTQEAIDKGYRSRLIDEFQLLGMAERGFITGPDGKPFGSTGIVVNCPIVMRFL